MHGTAVSHSSRIREVCLESAEGDEEGGPGVSLQKGGDEEGGCVGIGRV